MPEKFQHELLLFFTHYYIQKQIPASWKTSLTILLYKSDNPSLLFNHRPIALANIIYNFLLALYIHIERNTKYYKITKKYVKQKCAHQDKYKC